MPSYLASETDLQAEIDALRQKFPDTQDLYREACVVLFFRHGITPTANKLYQLVRKGSMSAPAEALSRFWDTLRDKSRIRIEHPDVPDALRDVAGELVGALWQRAQASAQEAWAQLRAEAQSKIQVAENLAQSATLRTQELEQALRLSQQKLNVLQQQWTDSQSDLSRAQGMVSALQREVAAGVTQRRELQEGFGAAQQRFTHDLEQQRAVASAGEARHANDLKRLLLDVDRERVHVARLQKELEQTRHTLATQIELQQRQLLDKQLAFDALAQRCGGLEGSVTELRAQRDLLSHALEELRLRREATGPGQPLTRSPMKRATRSALPPKRLKRPL